MSTTAGETNPYPMYAAHRRRVELEWVVTIGAAGAVPATLDSQDDPGITMTHGTAGVYTLTFPASADTRGTLDVTIVSAAGTVKTYWMTAFAPNSGTASITFGNGGGTATDPANGDVLRFNLTLSMSKDF